MTTNYRRTTARHMANETGTDFRPGISSRVVIARHPIHPILVTLPITFLVSAFVTDLLYWRNQDAFWAQSSYWLLWAGIVTAVLAALTGMIDFFSIERVRAHSAGWIHAGLNTVSLILSIINLWRRSDNAEAAIVPWGLALSALVTVLLAISGWYGGELVYRYKIAVFGDVREPDEPAGSAQVAAD
jgi:uncharacterized membrane protein